MAVGAQRERITSELNPELLATPFRETTNWHVITGAPSCGKSTLVELLADRGFPTVEECARPFLEQEMASGRSIEEIHEHGAALQRGLLDLKLRVEASLDPARPLFLDCAVPGSLAWFRLFGIDPNEALGHCHRFHYASVFVLDPLPITADGMRFEDDTFTAFLDEWIERDYTALGYTPQRVPVMAPEARLAYLLEQVRGRRLEVQRPIGWVPALGDWFVAQSTAHGSTPSTSVETAGRRGGTGLTGS